MSGKVLLLECMSNPACLLVVITDSFPRYPTAYGTYGSRDLYRPEDAAGAGREGVKGSRSGEVPFAEQEGGEGGPEFSQVGYVPVFSNEPVSKQGNFWTPHSFSISLNSCNHEQL